MRKNQITPISRWFTSIGLYIWTILCIYPLVFAFFQSLKNNKQVYSGSAWDLPDFPLLWSNYVYTWENYNFSSYFVNSILVTIGSIFVSLLMASTTAYVLARYRFRGSGLIFYMYLASMSIPTMMIIVPIFFLYGDLHLANTHSGLILLYAISSLPLSLLLLIGFFKSLPHELEESAVIDGASHYGVFFRIMLPLAMPGLITISIINILNYWNEFSYALILMNDTRKYTLPIGLAYMQGEMQYRIEFGPLFAGLMISLVPMLVMYILFQNRINEGIVAGAVK
ncbi:sugar ABC transporter permease [Paenibacillus sp. MY03]|nr:sugar ABC transporter permease [Paenibacillus sp. MY03]